MKIILLLTGKTTDKNIAELVELYSGRIKRYSAFEIITLPDVKNTKNMPVEEQKIKEAARIIQSFTEDDYIILLDERGKEMKSCFFFRKSGLSLLLEVHGVLQIPFTPELILRCHCQK
jgi:23S rRNA (pseudouridine1915-N3)-methyltransferase